MFYSQFILAKKGPLGTIWIAAHLERKLRKNQVADTDIGVSVDSILFPEMPIALRLSSHLLLGVVRIYSRKVNYLFDDCSEALLKIKQAFRSTAVDLPPEESKAPYHSITLPETFDLDDFELPDDEIFQGKKYVDQHVSAREQITLQDTVDGVAYSTSQFGLDERFGDGGTSEIGLELEEEEILHDRVAADKDDDYDGDYPQVSDEETDAPGKDSSGVANVGAPEMILFDGSQPQVNDVVANSEFNEDAQAPQTPGLFEVPTLSSVRTELASEDHMELEDQNSTEVTEKCGDALIELDHQQPQRSVENWCIENSLNCDSMPDDRRCVVEGQNKSLKDLEVVRVTTGRVYGECVESPCSSLLTVGLEGPGRIESVPEAHNDAAGADAMNDLKSFNTDVTCSYEPLARATVDAENLASQTTDHGPASRKQGEECHENLINKELIEGQAAVGRSEEQVDEALVGNNQSENVNECSSHDVLAPEKLLCVPQDIVYREGDVMIESTLHKEIAADDGIAGTAQISGKKRSFTESTLTMESFNSVESVGLSRTKRTVESLPDDDDLLLSSILAGRSTLLKMKPSPLPEVAPAKRMRLAPRATASKRKVLMDDPMVLHGDIIRQQLVNTEDIRRARKKAPCTRPEILMLQRQFLEDELLTESIFTGMCAELVSLYGEPCDARVLRFAPNVEEYPFARLGEVPCLAQADGIGGNVIGGITGLSVPMNDVPVPPAQITSQSGNQCIEGQDGLSQNASSGGVEMQFGSSETPGEKHETRETEVIGGEKITEGICEILRERNDLPDEKVDGELNICAPLVIGNRNDPDAIEVVECDVEKPFGNEIDSKCGSDLNGAKFAESGIDHGIQEENPVSCEVNDSVAAQSVGAGSPFDMSLVYGDKSIVEAEMEKPDDKCLESETKEVIFNGIYEEGGVQQIPLDTEFDVRNDFLKNGETMVVEQVDVGKTLDAGKICQDSSAGHHNTDSYKPLSTNDTGFLNVDDDEIPEDDDYEEDDEYEVDGRLMDNSGWSSRTRAVAKYLKTLFEKESVHAAKVVLVDNLLHGKTRREASRMFFETLVLKTRDYVDVEQPNAFDNIGIKPRTKLMKSDF